LTLSAGRLHAGFVSSGRGRIFVTARLVGTRSPGVLVVPAFAEEMNKSRRMITELAIALASRGVSTIIPDLYGTGDSEGEFADATVAHWLDDLEAVTAWSGQLGIEIRSILGVRFGGLLASEFVRKRRIGMQRCVFWQPIVDGARMLDQFLRLRVAAQMLGGTKESVAGLREALRNGRVEVAGYELSAELVAGVDALKLTAEGARLLGCIEWVELLRSAETPVGAPSVRAIDALKAAGCEVTLHTETGEPFWMSTEIVTSPAVVAASVDVLCRAA
jgi:exosortase A-associated hydrolase 2